MAGKDVFVILAFHAHEPHWDQPMFLLDRLDDEEMRNSVRGDNWIVKRAEAGRDAYRDLLRFAEEMKVPVCLEATNELLMQISEFMPATFRALREAYSGRTIYPIYGFAHHTHAALLTDAEVADEIRLNREFVHGVLGAPEARYRGLFPIEGSIDARLLSTIYRAHIDFLVFPHLSPRKARYRLEGAGDPVHEPFVVGPGIVALPRHFSVSQDIWRPITRWKPDGVRAQGYMLGQYFVFDEEYRQERSLPFPITRSEAVAEYCEVVRRAVASAPDGGLILYIQDLELMDFAEEALELLQEAWSAVRLSGEARLHFVTPDDYLDHVLTRGRPLPRLRFHQISWAPEVRLVLRPDGHYPPLDAGPFRGVDLSEEVFRRWPFIFWETGRFIVDVFNTLLTSFGHALRLPLSVADLRDRGYAFDRLNPDETVTLHSRVMKRADNWGWRPDEDRQKRPYLHAYYIADTLRRQLDDPELTRRLRYRFAPLSERSLKGLARLLEVFIDTRVGYLRQGIANLQERAGDRVEEAGEHLASAEKRRQRAAALALRAVRLNARLLKGGPPYPLQGIAALLEALQHHCREAFLATDEIQRAWGCIADTEGMVEEMYRYLYDLYPPLFPSILRDLLTPEELALVEKPPLR